MPKGRGTEGCGLPPPRLSHKTSALLRHRRREEQPGRAGWQEVPPGRDRCCLTPEFLKGSQHKDALSSPAGRPRGVLRQQEAAEALQNPRPRSKASAARCGSAAPCARCQGLPGLLIQSPAHKEGRTEAEASLHSQTLSRDPISSTLQVLSLPRAPAHPHQGRARARGAPPPIAAFLPGVTLYFSLGLVLFYFFF